MRVFASRSTSTGMWIELTWFSYLVFLDRIIILNLVSIYQQYIVHIRDRAATVQGVQNCVAMSRFIDADIGLSSLFPQKLSIARILN